MSSAPTKPSQQGRKHQEEQSNDDSATSTFLLLLSSTRRISLLVGFSLALLLHLASLACGSAVGHYVMTHNNKDNATLMVVDGLKISAGTAMIAFVTIVLVAPIVLANSVIISLRWLIKNISISVATIRRDDDREEEEPLPSRNNNNSNNNNTHNNNAKLTKLLKDAENCLVVGALGASVMVRMFLHHQPTATLGDPTFALMPYCLFRVFNREGLLLLLLPVTTLPPPPGDGGGDGDDDSEEQESNLTEEEQFEYVVLV